MATTLSGPEGTGIASPESQAAAYVEALKREKSGVVLRAKNVDEKADPKLAGYLAGRVKQIDAEIARAKKGVKEQATTETEDAEQATA